MKEPARRYEYVVAGAGSAGCLLARRLADAGSSVLLLEAGGTGAGNFRIKIPVGYLYTMGHPSADWCFVLRENPHLNGRRLPYPRGRVLGGSSAINGMIYMRGQSRDYDRWAESCPGWSWKETLPFFIRHERNESLGGELHGQEGEMWVSELRSRWKILDAFAEAAVSCGIPKTTDFNAGDNFGVGYFQVNQRRGMRHTAADAFLGRSPAGARPPPSLEVICQAQARRVLIENGRACGVEYQSPQGIETAYADREVILSAGSIGSPHILQCSGLGPPEVLEQAGVKVLSPLSGVGENLQDHLQIRPAFKVRGVRTLNEMSHSLAAKAVMAAEYALLRSGPLSSAPSQLGLFAKSDPSEPSPDLQYHVQPLSLDRFGAPLHREPGFTASVCHLRPHSRGFVRIESADPLAPPVIDARHLSEEYDRVVAARAIRHAREICAAAPLAKYAPEEIAPGTPAQTDAELAQAAGTYSTTIFHPCGTCKMGADSDPLAVVDAQLRVRGVERLRVADASIMPDIISGNTNAPTMMIAEKAAAMILENRA